MKSVGVLEFRRTPDPQSKVIDVEAPLTFWQKLLKLFGL